MNAIKQLSYGLWVLFVTAVQLFLLLAWGFLVFSLFVGSRHAIGHGTVLAVLAAFTLMLTAWFNMWHFFHRLKGVDREAYADALKGEWSRCTQAA